MTKPFWISLVLIIFFYVGCKKKQGSSEPLAVAKDTIVEKVVQIKFKTLTPDAVKELNELPEFKPLKAALDSLQFVTLANNDDLVAKLNDSALDFEELLPQKFKTNPIIARLKVLVTETGMLNQKVNLGILTNETLNTSKTNIAKAYDNFVDQVNELYLEIPENIAKELLQDAEVLIDSVSTP